MKELEHSTEQFSKYEEKLKKLEETLLGVEDVTSRINAAFYALPNSLTNIGKIGNSFSEMNNHLKKFKDFFLDKEVPAALNELNQKSKEVHTNLGSNVDVSTKKMSGFKATLGKITGAFSKLLSPVGLVVTAIAVLAGAFAYLMATNDGFRESIMGLLDQISAAFAPVISTLVTSFKPTLQEIFETMKGFLPMLADIFLAIATLVANVITTIAPIVGFIAGIITGIVTILLAAATKIADIFLTIWSTIANIWLNIKTHIANVIAGITNIISTLKTTIANVFNVIFSTVQNVMSKIGNVMSNIFASVKSAWGGLTTFVGGVFSGIANAFSVVTSRIKSVVNTVIRGINRAIGVINMIPGVSISRIAQLYHGTDNWQGGFAYMNEGGRGELTYLPNGSQVIPHDVSIKYAKEAARANAAGTVAAIDYDYLINGLAKAMSNVQVRHTSVINGKEVANQVTPLVNRNLGTMRRLAERGVY